LNRVEEFVLVERPRLEAAIQGLIDPLGPPLGAAAAYAVGAGGKRIRPLLTVAAHDAASGDGDRAGGVDGRSHLYRVAAAVELIHTYSLIHDDLPCMDDDALRRGLPTTHRVYGTTVATATGAALQQVAFLALGRAAQTASGLATRLPSIVRRLASAVGGEGMVGGQILDLEAEGPPPDAAGLEAIHRAKTAALISAACALGGLTAGAASHTVRALGSYGAQLGLAFQIVDDLLDVTGDPSDTGKAVGVDEARAKATYPAVHGVDRTQQQARLAGNSALDELAQLPGDTSVLVGMVDFVLDRLH
jgi:geranylgeranyl diphosphate synthase type II